MYNNINIFGNFKKSKVNYTQNLGHKIGGVVFLPKLINKKIEMCKKKLQKKYSIIS